jgi:hypothetical protein
VKSSNAKDFLVERAAEQAALEGASLSPLERRMMYLSKGDPDSEHLLTEFEAQPWATISEAKISLLLHHAYERLRKNDRKASAVWEDAVRALESGEHYLFKFWNLIPLHEIHRGPKWMRLSIGLRMSDAIKSLCARLPRKRWSFFSNNQHRLWHEEPSDKVAMSPVLSATIVPSVVSPRCSSPKMT